MRDFEISPGEREKKFPRARFRKFSRREYTYILRVLNGVCSFFEKVPVCEAFKMVHVLSPELSAVKNWLMGKGLDCRDLPVASVVDTFYVCLGFGAEFEDTPKGWLQLIPGGECDDFMGIVFYVTLRGGRVQVKFRGRGVVRVRDFDLADPECFDKVESALVRERWDDVS